MSRLPALDNLDLNYGAIQRISALRLSDSISFGVLGDCKNSPVFDYVVKAINQDKSLNFCIINGDLVFYPTMDTYRDFLSRWRRIKVPTLVIPGNHEIEAQGRSIYYTVFGGFYYSLEVGNSFLIMLDDSNGRSLGREQTLWLRRQLEKSLKFRHRFIFLHVPLRDPRYNRTSYSHSLRNHNLVNVLENLFLKYKVTAVFASHIHAYYEYSMDGVRYIITGGGGARLSVDDPAHGFFHYVRVSVRGDRVRIEPVKVEIKDFWARISDYFVFAKLYVLTLLKVYAGQLTTILLLSLLNLSVLMRRGKEGK